MFNPGDFLCIEEAGLVPIEFTGKYDVYIFSQVTPILLPTGESLGLQSYFAWLDCPALSSYYRHMAKLDLFHLPSHTNRSDHLWHNFLHPCIIFASPRYVNACCLALSTKVHSDIAMYATVNTNVRSGKRGLPENGLSSTTRARGVSSLRDEVSLVRGANRWFIL